MIKTIAYNYNHYADAKYYKTIILKKEGKIKEAKELIQSALEDFKNGYVNHRDYIEVLRQLYFDDYKELQLSLK